MNDKLFNLFNKVRIETNDNVILSGSLALILHKVIKPRECNDLDLIVPKYFDLSKLGEVNISPQTYIDRSCIIKTKEGIGIDLIVSNTRVYSIIDGMKVASIESIICKKMESLAYFKNEKHIKDIVSYLKTFDKTIEL